MFRAALPPRLTDRLAAVAIALALHSAAVALAVVVLASRGTTIPAQAPSSPIVGVLRCTQARDAGRSAAARCDRQGGRSLRRRARWRREGRRLPRRGGDEVFAIDPRRMTRPRPSGSCASGPSMPEQARLMGITGAVVARYVVHADGRVGEVQILNPSAPPVLIGAAGAHRRRPHLSRRVPVHPLARER